MKADAAAAAEEVEWARCECCGLTEECTPAYISKVRERHLGRWVCGLCAEAVKDEIGRSGWPIISTAEAIDRHASFFRAFRAVPPADHAAQHLVAAIARLLRRSLDSPRLQPQPQLPDDAAAASRSCFATLRIKLNK